jgi:DNA-directed RNA polymerase specialized sigma24 family protein
MSSVNALIGRLRAGNPAAFRQVFDRFFRSHVARLERRLGAAYPGIEGPEDVALSVFGRLWGVVVAQSPLTSALSDRRGLLRILSVLTRQKLREVYRYEHRQQRDSHRTRREADLSSSGSGCSSAQETAASAPPVDWDVAFLDLLTHLLGQLSERQQAVALRKLDGLSSREIAAELRCSQRTVERQLSEIRDRWRRHPDLAAALQLPPEPGNAATT